jgi:hypothetical protein
MNNPIVTNSRDLRHYAVAAWLAGLVTGACLTGAITYASAEPEVIDPRMEKACQWPKRHGQAMMVVVLDGKIHCWEMGR